MYPTNSKFIIFSPSCGGKTTIIQHLMELVDRSLLTKLYVSEIDKELSELNEGEYPVDYEHRMKVILPKVIDKVLSQDSLIFFSNTDYFTIDDVVKAREVGFQIVNLRVPYLELVQRNELRVKNQGYDSQLEWLKGMIEYQDALSNQGLIDHELDGMGEIEQVVNRVISLLK